MAGKRKDNKCNLKNSADNKNNTPVQKKCFNNNWHGDASILNKSFNHNWNDEISNINKSNYNDFASHKSSEVQPDLAEILHNKYRELDEMRKLFNANNSVDPDKDAALKFVEECLSNLTTQAKEESKSNDKTSNTFGVPSLKINPIKSFQYLSNLATEHNKFDLFESYDDTVYNEEYLYKAFKAGLVSNDEKAFQHSTGITNVSDI